jgi:hypothetical protein
MAAVYQDGCITVWEIMAGADTATVKHRLWPGCRKGSITSPKIDDSGARLAACSYDAGKDKLFVFTLIVQNCCLYLSERSLEPHCTWRIYHFRAVVIE